MKEKPNPTDDDDRAHAADHCSTQLVRARAEADHDDGHLETLEDNSLEGKKPGGPVHSNAPPLIRITLRIRPADAREPAGGDAHDALSEPLQAEDEQQGADHQTKRTDGNGTERGTEDNHGHRQHTESGGYANDGGAPSASCPNADHDRDHLDRFNG